MEAHDLKKEILEKIGQYYRIAHKKTFVPGKTKVNYAGRIYDEEEMKAMAESLLEFTLTYGKYAIKFEKEFAKFNNVKYSVLTNSGSSANLLAVSALKSYKLKNPLKNNDEVITPVCTFPTTLNPIIQNNLTPVFIDVELGTYNIKLSLLEKALSKKTKALFIPHTLGNPNNMNFLVEFAKKNNLYLIEDNCDALDSKYSGKKCGSFGDMATSSFFPAHHMTMGEGGAVLTSNALLKTILRSIRDWGRDCWCEPGKSNTCGRRFKFKLGGIDYDHKYIYGHIGYNLRPLDLQAAMGLVQLKKLPYFTKKRKENFKILYRFFKKYEKWLILPKALEKSEPSWFAFPLTIRDNAPFSRKQITSYLEKNMIETRPLFAGNILKHPAYKKISFKHRIVGSTENADKILRDSFFIGLYPGIDNARITYMMKCAEQFFKNL